jgi:hypothetical protein
MLRQRCVLIEKIIELIEGNVYDCKWSLSNFSIFGITFSQHFKKEKILSSNNFLAISNLPQIGAGPWTSS